jgi:formylglycine-generating enzyme required for sulfatase activity
MKTSWMPRAGVIALAVVFGASLAHAQGDELLVTNVQAQQRPFSVLVDITYDLETIGDIAVTVSLTLSADGGANFTYPCLTMTGDVGAGVLPGTGKHIVWDAGIDYPDLNSTTCQLRVTADDGVVEIPDFVAIPAGTFTMGSPMDEPGRYSGEVQHQVTLTHGFFIQATEVTNQQYMELAQWAYGLGYVTVAPGDTSLRDNLDGSTANLLPLVSEISFSSGVFSCTNPTHPVKYVTWYGSVAYCDWLSLQQGLPRAYNHSTWQCNNHDPYSAAGYRLPTEAEWEYACRAGSVTAFANGPIMNIYCSPLDANLDMMGWYCGNAGNWTHPVGLKMPNAWGLYDMHGNLWEWCNDWNAAYNGAVTNPVGPASGSSRVLRGGVWSYDAQFCRSASRDNNFPSRSNLYIGFRSARSAD